MQYMNIQKNIGHSPRKLRLVADLVRSMAPEQAINTLHFVNKVAAADLAKAIKTAVANSGGRTGLRFQSLEINEGFSYKRMRPGSKGRPKRYVKKLSHIKVVLTDEVLAPKVPVAAVKQALEQKIMAKTEPVVEVVEKVVKKATVKKGKV